MNTKTDLGVSPIISMPYTVSAIWHFNLGQATFIAYILFIIIQIAALRKNFKLFQLFQVIISLITSAFINSFNNILNIHFTNMPPKIILMVLAIILTGIGAAITVNMKIIPNPADALAKVIGDKLKKGMGFGKNVFDFTSLAISLSIGLIFVGQPVGIGLGAIANMLFTGRVISLFNKLFKKKVDILVGL
ncbi:DUF6198 family protein [Clostridium sp. SHJSY1]|nr:DUF6198 family protein [Clostridium sp. SHJSY1]